MSDVESKMVTLKLIGAGGYICPRAGITVPVKAGEFVDLPAHIADSFLQEYYTVNRKQFPVWSDDPNAEIELNGVPMLSLEQRQFMASQQKEADDKLSAALAEKEEAMGREAVLAERIANLEKMFADKDAAKPVARKRKAAATK